MHTIISFAQAHAELNQFVSQTPRVTGYTLDNITAFMAYLGDPQNKLKIIHVAGTSGKTSTAYYAAALLSAAGHTTGLTVSPHIDEVSERAQINLQPLPEAEYCRELSEFLDLVDVSKIELSYFEILVAFAYWLFDKKQVEYAVVEVGLGGLLDGTNVINREDKVCIITDIGLDHVDILGDTLPKIASQKAGIIHSGNVVFMNQQPAEVVEVISTISQREHAQLHVVSPDIEAKVQLPSALPLFQRRNLLLALEAVDYVSMRDHRSELTPEQIRQASLVHIPGRMEIVQYEGKTLVLDGSHNEQKIGALVESMRSQFAHKTMTILVSFGHNKEPSVIASLRLLQQLSSALIVTAFHAGQDEQRVPIELEKLAQYAKQAEFIDITLEADPERALQRLMGSDTDIRLVTGSFYLLNQIREVVFNNK